MQVEVVKHAVAGSLEEETCEHLFLKTCAQRYTPKTCGGKLCKFRASSRAVLCLPSPEIN